jgi:hypothetical protein
VTDWFAGRKTPTLEQGLTIQEFLRKRRKSFTVMIWWRKAAGVNHHPACRLTKGFPDFVDNIFLE